MKIIFDREHTSCLRTEIDITDELVEDIRQKVADGALSEIPNIDADYIVKALEYSYENYDTVKYSSWNGEEFTGYVADIIVDTIYEMLYNEPYEIIDEWTDKENLSIS